VEWLFLNCRILNCGTEAGSYLRLIDSCITQLIDSCITQLIDSCITQVGITAPFEGDTFLALGVEFVVRYLGEEVTQGQIKR